MVQDDLHGRGVGKISILLIEAEESRVEMDDEGWRFVLVLLEDVGRDFH